MFTDVPTLAARYIRCVRGRATLYFVHFKSQPTSEYIIFHQTTVPRDLLFRIRVYTSHQFINWNFVAGNLSVLNRKRVQQLFEILLLVKCTRHFAMASINQSAHTLGVFVRLGLLN